MDVVFPAPPRCSRALWRDTISPQEHGSWSLAFEPLVLSLLVAPSAPGVLLAISLAAAFFVRRPLRIARGERRAERRVAAQWAVAGCGGVALVALAAAIALGGVGWLGWLAPMMVAGGIFAWFDLRGDGRAEVAEVTGAAVFALAPAAFAAVAGWTGSEAVALALIVLGRAVPSVLMVRAFLRGAKTGIRRDLPAVVTAGAALIMAWLLFARGLAPFLALAAMMVFAGRALALLVVVRPAWRARTVGMMEAILGLAFVAGLALTWRG